jgi:hypothetical protein
MDETRIRALVEKAFKAGFDWCLSGIDRYGSYNGGPIADGLTRFLELEAALQAASPVPRVETRCECATCLLNANPPVPRSTPVQRTHEED